MQTPNQEKKALRWADLSIRVKGAIVVSLPFAVLVLGVASGSLASKEEREARRWISEAHQTQADLRSLAEHAKETESAMRGFLLFADHELYEGFLDAKEKALAMVRRLKVVPNRTQGQAGSLKELEALVVERMDLLGSEVRRLETGHVAAAPMDEAAPKLRAGEKLSARMKHTIQTMEREEETLLAARLEILARAEKWDFVSRLFAIFGGMGGAILALILFGGRIIRRVNRLEENALRLAQGEPLVKICESRDELGLLERNLEQTSILLAERTRALREAKDEADRANAAKSDFLSRMSHELRTPLNAILGFGQLMELDDLTPEQNECIEQIVRGGRHLLSLINEVLDIARIEAGHMSISTEPVLPGEILRECIELLRPLAQSRSLLIESQIEECAFYVRADRSRLRQVVLNLISNAIKYNREGGSIRMTCEQKGAAIGRIEIEDTGYGIAPSDLERLFRPFERLNASESVEGTGLGLALAKRLVELMGGEIGAESDIGKGSVFWIELPQTGAPCWESVEEARTRQPSFDLTRPLVILYVEDNLANLKLVEAIFSRRPNVKLLSAMQGRLGIDLARESHPDLILLDLNLPDIAGREVFQQLRGEARTANVPIIIISADVVSGEIKRMLDAGADGYITKPFAVAEFLATVDGVIDGTAARIGMPV